MMAPSNAVGNNSQRFAIIVDPANERQIQPKVDAAFPLHRVGGSDPLADHGSRLALGFGRQWEQAIMPTNDAPLIRAADVVKSYGTAAAPVHALRGVSVDIRRGERVALLGKSGSGKSTLLNLFGGLDRPTSGTIEVAGRDLARMAGDELARHRLATVGIVFHSALQRAR
jgi:ABC-type glutathione transport system ATPase component